MTRPAGYWKANKSTQALIAFGVEAACVGVALYFSWMAALCVIVAIFTQAGWQVYLQEQEKETP